MSASVDPSMIGELLLYIYEHLNKQAPNNERNSLMSFYDISLHSSGVTGGGGGRQSAPRDFRPGNFC